MDFLKTALDLRAVLMASLHKEGTTCFRLVTEDECGFGDIDIFEDPKGDLRAFVVIKETSPQMAQGLLKQISHELSKIISKPVVCVGGAYKNSSGASVPLLPYIGVDAAHDAKPWGLTSEFGCLYRLEFSEVLNPGLFIDQRENRRELLKRLGGGGDRGVGAGGKTLLNLFSYTGAFSVLAAKCGVNTMSVDASKRYLEWERANQELNGTETLSKRYLDDARKFLARRTKKIAPAQQGNQQGTDEGAVQYYDHIVIDPPTFSRTKQGVFRVQDELPELLNSAARLLSRKEGSSILVSCNDTLWSRQKFNDECAHIADANNLNYKEGSLAFDVAPTQQEKEDYMLRSMLLFRSF